MHLSVAILFLVTTIVNRGCYAVDICPAGPSLKAPMYIELPYCENDNVMFDGHMDYCCESYATETCKHTGMRSKMFSNFYTRIGWFYALTKQDTDDMYAGYVYDVKKGSKHFVCPYPIGFLWFALKLTRTDTPKQEYLPVDHKDTTSILKTCEANKDCAADEFCGDVINYSDVENFARKCSRNGMPCTGPYVCYKSDKDNYCAEKHNSVFVDRKVHFCYKNPKLDQNRGKTQLAMDSSRRNLKFCDSDADCRTDDKRANCHTTLAPEVSSLSYARITWTEFIPDKDTSKEGSKMEYFGLCVEDIPYSYILSHIFDSLSESDQLGEVGKKFLPVDYDAVKKRLDQLKKCDYNKDCDKGQFCGTIYSLTEPAKQHPNVRFCFTSVVHNDASKRYTVLPDKKDIITCETAADCVAEGAKNSTCYISGGINYLKKDQIVITLVKGICAGRNEDERRRMKKKNEEEEGSSMMIIVVVVVVLIVIILAALIGGFVFYKLKMKKGKNGKKGKNDKSELTKKRKKEKKGKKGKKKNKKGNKTSKSTASTTKSTSITGQSGMGTTTGGYSPAIY